MAQNTIFPLFNEGHVGPFTVYTDSKGRIIIRQRHNAGGKHIQTLARMKNWVRWGNNVRLYQALAPYIRDAFSSKGPRQTDFNAFMQLAVPKSRVYIPKEDMRLGACVLEPGVVVSTGLEADLLPISIEVLEQDELLASNIKLRQLTTIDSDTTVADFAVDVVRSNPLIFKEGDELAFLRASQNFDTALGIPWVSAISFRVGLNFQDERKLLGITGADGFALRELTVGGVSGRYLTAPLESDSCGCWLHARTLPDKRIIYSTQYLAGANSILPDYTSDAAMEKAIRSYGGVNREPYMSSDTVVLTYEQVFGPAGGTQPGGGSGTGTGSDPTTPGTTPGGSTPTNPPSGGDGEDGFSR